MVISLQQNPKNDIHLHRITSIKIKNINIIKILNIHIHQQQSNNAVHIQDTEIKTDLHHIQQDITIMNTTTDNPDTVHIQETIIIIITIETTNIMTTPLLIVVVVVVITATSTIIAILQEAVVAVVVIVVATTATTAVVIIIHITIYLQHVIPNRIHGLQNHHQLIIYIQLLGISTVYSIVSIVIFNLISQIVKRKFEEMNKQQFNETVPISSTDKSKREKELYVTNLPNDLNPTKIVEILNTALRTIEANTTNQDPIIGAYTTSDKEFTFLQFRSIEDCNNAFKLNGMQILNKPIRIGKPIYSDDTNVTTQEKEMFPTLSSFEKDLNNKTSNTNHINQPLTINTVNTVQVNSNLLALNQYALNNQLNNIRANLIQSNTNNMPSTSKLLVSNLPLYFGENEIRKIFKFWGRIKYLDILHDSTTKKFNGQCNIEYETEKSTQEALHYAMGMKLGDNILYIKRSANINPPNVYNTTMSNQYNSNNNILYSNLLKNNNISTNNVRQGLTMITNTLNQSNSTNTIIPAISAEEYIKFRENNPSNVLCIKNMVTLDELEGNEEYKELNYDILEECKHYGKVIQVKIPRPSSDYGMLGVGKVFVEYANRDGASWAKKYMQGTTFRGRTLDVVFHPEESFRKGQYE